MGPGELTQQLRDTADLLNTYPPSTDALRALQAAENAIAAAGLCPRCHRAVHAGKLVIDSETRQFRDRYLRLLPGRGLDHRKRRRLTPDRVRRARTRIGA